MCPPRIGCYHRHNPHDEQQKEHCNYSSRHFGYARQLKLKIVIITLEINIPGSVTPNGWLVWPRPPTMLIPREPLHFVTVTRCRNTEKITVIKLTMTHTHTFNGPLSGTTWDEPVHTHTTHPFNGPFSGTTQVSRYQKGKTIWILLKQETVSGSGISWAIYASLHLAPNR